MSCATQCTVCDSGPSDNRHIVFDEFPGPALEGLEGDLRGQIERLQVLVGTLLKDRDQQRDSIAALTKRLNMLEALRGDGDNRSPRHREKDRSEEVIPVSPGRKKTANDGVQSRTSDRGR